MRVFFTVDLEQDCPPFLSSFRGIEEGMPRLFKMLDEEGIPATFFTTGDVARRYPDVVREIVDKGHELGCHGDTHRRFDKMNESEAEAEIIRATSELRKYYPVISFRAPCLQFPRKYLKHLFDEGYRVDSTQAKHKRLFLRPDRVSGIYRIPVSTTSIVLRSPRPVRNFFLRRLKDPVVLFVHPWEFVDLRSEKLRIDCRYNTGDKALMAVRETINFYLLKGADFFQMKDVLDGLPSLRGTLF